MSPTATEQKKLSVPQREALRNAAGHSGRVAIYNVKTQQILSGLGFIENGYAEQREDARVSLTAGRDREVSMAKARLDAGDWQSAFSFLSRAGIFQRQLDEKCWYITEAGRKAVAE